MVSPWMETARAKRPSADREKRPRVYFEEWDDPQICGIEWVSQLIELAGGEDVCADRCRGRMATDRITTPSSPRTVRIRIISDSVSSSIALLLM